MSRYLTDGLRLPDGRTRDLVLKARRVRVDICSRVMERETETDLMFVALLSGAPLLFLGDVGTAKTRHIDLFSSALGLTKFDELMSDSIKPDSIFGPTDVPALARGVQRRKVEGYAPACEVLFFDELFRASGIVLNPLLKLINEHEFRNGDEGVLRCPTLAVFAASNSVPTDESMRAIYDRFVVRHVVTYLRTPDSIHRMVALGAGDAADGVRMTREDVMRLRSVVPRVRVPAEIVDLTIKVRDQVQRACGTTISDRRLNRAIACMRARALLRGRRGVVASDVDVLASIFWDQPDHADKVRAVVLSSASASAVDTLAYEELARDVWDTALKTGDMTSARAKLAKLKESVDRMQTAAGKVAASTVAGLLQRADALLKDRSEFHVMLIRDSRGAWLKLSVATSSMWGPEQLRSVGFHWRKSEGYWWMGFAKVQINERRMVSKMTARVQTKLGVGVSIHAVT